MSGLEHSAFRRIEVAVLAVLLVGVGLRLGWLQHDSFWLDEAYSVQLASNHTAAELWAGDLDQVHPPLFYIVLRGALRVFGVSETSARLPSALSSVLNLGLIWILARNLRLGRRAAGAATVLLAFAPIDIWYAREARMYALVTTAALVFATGLTTKSRIGPVIAALALATGLYLDFTMIPLALALGAVWLVWWWYSGRQPWRLVSVLIVFAVGCVSAAPLWPRVAQLLHVVGGVTFFSHAARLAGIATLGATAVPLLLAGIAAGLIITAASAWRQMGKDRFRWWWGWLVWTGFIAATAGLAIPRAYSAKQILVTGWPFVILAVAWTLIECVPASAGSRSAARLGRPRLAAAIIVSFLATVGTVVTHRADWRGVVAYLDQRLPAGAVVWLDPAWNSIPYEYYHPRHPAVVNALPSTFGPRAARSAAREVWFVAERFGATAPSATETWLDAHFPVLEVVPFERLEVRRYNAAANVD